MTAPRCHLRLSHLELIARDGTINRVRWDALGYTPTGPRIPDAVRLANPRLPHAPALSLPQAALGARLHQRALEPLLRAGLLERTVRLPPSDVVLARLLPWLGALWIVPCLIVAAGEPLVTPWTWPEPERAFQPVWYPWVWLAVTAASAVAMWMWGVSMPRLLVGPHADLLRSPRTLALRITGGGVALIRADASEVFLPWSAANREDKLALRFDLPGRVMRVPLHVFATTASRAIVKAALQMHRRDSRRAEVERMRREDAFILRTLCLLIPGVLALALALGALIDPSAPPLTERIRIVAVALGACAATAGLVAAAQRRRRCRRLARRLRTTSLRGR